jgi:hypothetical protein
MKYKYIILIISCSKLDITSSSIHYLEKYQILKQYQKLYLDKFKDSIKFFFIEYKEDISDNIIEIDDFIFFKGTEDPVVPNLLVKDIEAIKYVKAKYDFDFILRTNLSSIWNIPNLLSLYDIKPKTGFFGGHAVFNSFVTGTGIFISKDLVEKLLTINISNFTVNDDVAISRHMLNNGIRIRGLNDLTNYKWNYQTININECDINSPEHKNNTLEINDNTYIDDILYFRVKNSSIEQDLIITRKIIKRIYNIEL